MGGGVGGGEREKARQCASTLKTEEAVDRRQNNGNVKAVSPRHCAATSVTYYAITVSAAVRGRATTDICLPGLRSKGCRWPAATLKSESFHQTNSLQMVGFHLSECEMSKTCST